MYEIRKLSNFSADELIQLTILLQDSVNGGASLGFLAPLNECVALDYWLSVLPKLNGEINLLVAQENSQIVATVQYVLCSKENGRHRAEVQKLMVLSSLRGKRLASQLMQQLEANVTQQGIKLLVLDTQVDSGAETVYQKLGWQRAGIIPNYAQNPTGVLCATAYYYKLLV